MINVFLVKPKSGHKTDAYIKEGERRYYFVRRSQATSDIWLTVSGKFRVSHRRNKTTFPRLKGLWVSTVVFVLIDF